MPGGRVAISGYLAALFCHAHACQTPVIIIISSSNSPTYFLCCSISSLLLPLLLPDPALRRSSSCLRAYATVGHVLLLRSGVEHASHTDLRT
jgi:hypothetical protein